MAIGKLILAIVHAKNLNTNVFEELTFELEHKPSSRDLLKRYMTNKLGRDYEVHKITVRTIRLQDYERSRIPKIPTIDI